MNTFRPPKRRFVRESRPLDFIYDPVYTLPSKVNFFKSANTATRIGDSKMRLRTDFPAMFSDIMTDRRVTGCLSSNKPDFMAKFIPEYDVSGTRVLPNGEGPPYDRMDDVRGSHRAKYFIKYSDPIAGLQRYNVTQSNGVKSTKSSRDFLTGAPFKSRGTQTDLREMDTQTDPYSPPFRLPHPDDYPKVLALVKMTWGRGLPATLEDILTIERALTRRLLELSDRATSTRNKDAFGEVTGEEDFVKRVKLMEDLEAQKWVEREKDLEKIKNMKMDLVVKQLQELKARNSQEQTLRLEKLFDMRKKDNAKRLQKIKNEYLRQLRKLERQHRVGKKVFKRDIILEYIDMESQIYAPVLRNGPNTDQLVSYAPDYQFTAHLDFDTLIYLTDMDSFANQHLRFDTKKFTKAAMKIKPNRATRIAERQLQDCYQTFNDVCKPKEEAMEDEMLNTMIMKSVRRMSTPENVVVCEEVEDDEEAVVLLQTLIRGRAVQSILRQEAENSMETILRMKELYETDPFGAHQPITDKLALRQQQRQRDVRIEQENETSELSEQVEGEILSNMMSFLEKEMTRLLDERKIHALIILAERERRMLEASEAGRRQKEEECQRTNDEIWRQVVGVHQQTVDIYLEDIYLESISRTADEGGRKYVQELARTVNEAAYVMERNIKDFDKDEIAADLVHSFLFPQVKREAVQRQMADLQGRYYTVATQVTNAVLNAKGVVQEVLDTIGTELKDRFEVGRQTVDASYCVVDHIIQGAVAKVIDDEFGPQLQQLAEEEAAEKARLELEEKERRREQRMKDRKAKRRRKKKEKAAAAAAGAAGAADASGESEGLEETEEAEGDADSEGEVEAEMLAKRIPLRRQSLVKTQAAPGVGLAAAMGDEGLVSEEEERRLDPSDIPIDIDVDLVGDLIGLKSMELDATATVGVETKELGETAVKVYDAACITVDDLINNVQNCFKLSDDETDVELDDQDIEE